MNKDDYRKAMDDISVDQGLIDKTRNRIANDKVHIKIKRYIAIAACILIFMTGALTYSKLPSYRQSTMKVASHNTILPQIKDNYVVFDALKDAFDSSSAKIPQASCSPSYQYIKNESTAAIICTVKDIGIYRKKAEELNTKVIFGTYIYTVKVDKILSGNINKEVGSIIPISETSVIDFVRDKNGIKTGEVSYNPYTSRPEETRILQKEKQYVMFLSKKDETGCYRLSSCGFGVFPIEYINKISKSYSLDEMKKKYGYVNGECSSPLKDDNLYKVCCLEVKKEFLNN